MTKTDINLIPRKKAPPKAVSIGVPAAIALIVLLISAGFYLPSKMLESKQSELLILENELSGYADIKTDYLLKSRRLTALQAEKDNIDGFFSTNRESLDMATALEKIIPPSITILKYEYAVDNITIFGSATADTEIAGFEDSLWRSGMFSDMILGTISGEEGVRTFDFVLIYKASPKQGGAAQ
ncbi:MAG: PilN domain-containing protein [Eubacteriales bacterium]|nr:PilN domain-containing protein [Eubacteriales bacterium]